MKVEKLGEGEAEFAVVGSIHGDEPCGKKAIEKFLSEDWKIKKPVKFVVANEKALKQGKRFLDTDLNRCFPGDSQSSSHEKRLAAKIMQELQGTTVLDIHSTHSYPKPFATLSSLNKSKRKNVAATGVQKAVIFEEDSDTMVRHLDGVLVEAGDQGTKQAAENAYKVITNFMAAKGVIEADFSVSDPEYFRYKETVEGNYTFTAENFKKVRKGEVYAKNGEEKLKASEDFYPVLMSTNGYQDMLGFKAQKI